MLTLFGSFFIAIVIFSCYSIIMSDVENSFFPDKVALKESYDVFMPILTAILFSIEHKLKKTINLPSKPTYKTRVKGFTSYYKKLMRIKPYALKDEKLPALSDLIGIRIICPFLEDLQKVEKQITNEFSIIEIEKKGTERTFREFGYESIHILIHIPEEFRSDKIALPKNLVCEIQIRTILQDAWAEVEHELVYKSEFSPFDLPLRRKLASMNASLSLADIIFQEIRDYQNKLNNELLNRRDSFFEQADSISKNFLLPEAPEAKVSLESASPYVQGTIDDMILEAIHSHNQGYLDRAIEIYTLIIESKPALHELVLSVMYKHRGMAYFSQNKYQNALDDFMESVRFDASNFRSFYYVGIVYSVLEDHRKAIDYYDKSLEINEFQAFVFFRRALSYYHLKDYTRSMNDLDKARKLGLDDSETQALKETLISKLGIGMN